MIIAATILFILLPLAVRGKDHTTTIRQQMEWLHRIQKVNFTYDASLPVGNTYRGPSLKGMTLAKALSTLFKDSGISYSVNGNYIILKAAKQEKTHPHSQPQPRKATLAPPRRHTLSGYVRDTSGETLINATVWDETTGTGTTTNAYGFYSLTLPRGEHHIKFSYLGFADQKISTKLESNLRQDVALKEDNRLPEVVVEGDLNSPLLNTQTGKRSISQADIKTGYALLSSPDVVKTLQRTSGVAEGVELTSGLYVHGGNNDENLFLLDGTPLYQINHTLGLFSSFNADIVKNVDFYKSGFPARYGGRLSSVIDVRTTDGDMQHYHGSVRLGLLDGGLQFEGPIQRGKTSFNIALRRSWLDLITRPVFSYINHHAGEDDDKVNIAYFFHDFNAKVTHLFSDRSRLSLSTYWGQDRLSTRDEYDYSYGAMSYYTYDGRRIDDSNHGTEKDLTKNHFNWGNFNAALDWTYILSPKFFANITGVYTYSLSKLRSLEDDRVMDTNGIESSRQYTEHGYHSTINDVGYRMAFDYRPTPRHHIRFGHDFTLHHFRPQSNDQINIFSNDGEGDTTKVSSKSHLAATELNVYAEDEMTLSNHWSLNAGMNMALFHVQGKTFMNLDPRAAVKYQPNRYLSFKASYTTMTQFVHKISNAYIDLPSDYWVPTTARLHPMHSHQWAAGVYLQPNHHWLLSMEGYYKWSSHLLQYTNWQGLEPPANNWDTKVMEGHGRFYGLEFDAHYATHRLQLDASYTLSWNKRKFEEYFPDWYYDKFDNRHKINASVRYTFGKGTHLYAEWLYHSGNRLTVPTQYVNYPDLGDGGEEDFLFERPNNVSAPAYHRLDIGVDIHHRTKHGHERIWNWSIYNAYCHLNTMWIDMEYNDSTGTFKAKAKGYIPIIPSFSYTYKF